MRWAGSLLPAAGPGWSAPQHAWAPGDQVRARVHPDSAWTAGTLQELRADGLVIRVPHHVLLADGSRVPEPPTRVALCVADAAQAQVYTRPHGDPVARALAGGACDLLLTGAAAEAGLVSTLGAAVFALAARPAAGAAVGAWAPWPHWRDLLPQVRAGPGALPPQSPGLPEVRVRLARPQRVRALGGPGNWGPVGTATGVSGDTLFLATTARDVAAFPIRGLSQCQVRASQERPTGARSRRRAPDAWCRPAPRRAPCVPWDAAPPCGWGRASVGRRGSAGSPCGGAAGCTWWRSSRSDRRGGWARWPMCGAAGARGRRAARTTSAPAATRPPWGWRGRAPTRGASAWWPARRTGGGLLDDPPGAGCPAVLRGRLSGSGAPGRPPSRERAILGADGWAPSCHSVCCATHSITRLPGCGLPRMPTA